MEAFKLMQMASAYGQSLLSYHLGGAPSPFSASFAVSNRCNLRCSYCNFPLMEEPELTLAQVDTLFDRLREMGVRRLGILGGEPLYRSDIIDIIHQAKKKDFFISLNTNLLLYPKFRDRLADVDHFFTSLDGDPEKHELNRGKQSYDKILSAIRDIVGRGKPLTAICVVTEPDRAMADYLLALADREHIQIHFQPECFDTEIVLRSADDSMNQTAIREFWHYLATCKRQGASIASSADYLEYIANWEDFRKSSVLDMDSKCAAGRGFLFVDSTGHAYPCAYTKGKAEGVNLLREDWRGTFKHTPCTRCIVGPMLEFNLLFNRPVRSVFNALKQYG
ncbi:MAG: radical SAM protein [Flavobacteriales bacterium]|nr:radical SAM protein [Flavobacteriales bacterium]